MFDIDLLQKDTQLGDRNEFGGTREIESRPLQKGATSPLVSYACDEKNQQIYTHVYGEQKNVTSPYFVTCIDAVVQPPHTPEQIAQFKSNGRCYSQVPLPLSSDASYNYYPKSLEGMTVMTEDTTYTVEEDGACRTFCDNGGNGIVFRHQNGNIIRTAFLEIYGTYTKWWSDKPSGQVYATFWYSQAWCMPRANPVDVIEPTEPSTTLEPPSTCGCHEPRFLIPSEAPNCKLLKDAKSKTQCVAYVKQTKTYDGYKYTCGARDRNDKSEFFLVDSEKISTSGDVQNDLKEISCKEESRSFVDAEGNPFTRSFICLKKSA